MLQTVRSIAWEMNVSEEQTLKELEPFALPGRKAKLWRYMDLAQFVDLARNRKLYMGSVAGLDDAYEGMLPPVLQQQLPSDHPMSDPRGWAVSCWHLSEFENYGMWKLYGTQRGVAIQSTCSRLQEALLPTHEFSLARVCYWDYSPNAAFPDNFPPLGKWMQDDRLPFLCKRREFTHEEEVRVLHDMREIEIVESWLQDAQIDNINVSIPCLIETLVERVYLHPRAERWVRNLIKRLVQDWLPGVPVCQVPDPPRK